MVCSILGIDKNNLEINKDGIFGNLIENHVFSELLKQSTLLEKKVSIYHYRNVRQKEVDLIIEAKDGLIIAIEVKAKSLIKQSDLKGLVEIARGTDKLLNGYVIYTGEEIMPISSNGFMFYLIPLKLFC